MDEPGNSQWENRDCVLFPWEQHWLKVWEAPVRAPTLFFFGSPEFCEDPSLLSGLAPAFSSQSGGLGGGPLSTAICLQRERRHQGIACGSSAQFWGSLTTSCLLVLPWVTAVRGAGPYITRGFPALGRFPGLVSLGGATLYFGGAGVWARAWFHNLLSLTVLGQCHHK